MTTRLFRSSDVGAPAHSGTTLGQILTILRACLVDGYGTRTPAGWTMPFSDLPNNKAVFRGQSGVGDYFRVDDNQNYEYSEITGFATMTDVDTGTEQYPKIGAGANDDVTVWKCINRDGTTATYDDWFCIADEETCYIVFLGSSNYRSIIGFGEYEKMSITSTVPNQFVIGLNYPSSVSISIQEYGFFKGSNSYRWCYQRRNQWNDIQRSVALNSHFFTTDFTQPNPLDGKFYFNKIGIIDDIAPIDNRWGWFKDLLVMREGGSASMFSHIGDLLTIESQTYIIAKSFTNYIWAFRYDIDVG